MTQHTQNPPVRTPTDRLIDALSDPNRLFTPAEVAYLMSSAGRWGYDAAALEMAADPLSWRAGYDAGRRDAEAEISVGYPPPPYLITQGIRVRGDQADARAEANADRTEIYRGGAVAEWGADRPDLTPAQVSVRVVRSGTTCTWKDA